MIQITGKTYEWKNELKDAGFRWNADAKVWERATGIDEKADWRLVLGLNCGDLRYANQATTRSQSAHAATVAALQFEGGYE